MALAAVLGGLPSEIRRMTDLQKCLDIDKRLSWQVFTFVTAGSPIAAGSQLPGTAAMSRFLDLASRKGVSPQVVGHAKSVVKDLSALIATHAGDKRTFDAMLSGLEGEDVDAIDIATRRQAFRANSRICGVQAKVQLALAAINTNSDSPDQVDILGLRGLLNLRRIRHNATYVFASIMIGDDDGVRRRTLNSTPLDPEGLTAEGADLIRRFSSTPPPEFRQSRDPAGRTNIEIVGNGVGNESSVTYFGGSLLKQSGGRYRNEKNRYHEVFSPVRVPTEVFILDVLVGEGTFSQVEPTAMVFGNYRGCDPMVTYGRECDLLPLGQTVQYLGRGLSALLTPDLPRYTELIEYAFGRADWNIDQFDAYRCRLEYPVMPSTVAVRFDLAKEPSGTE